MNKTLLIAGVALVAGMNCFAGYSDAYDAEIAAMPADYTRFEFKGHPAESELLSHYLWYHYKTRLLHLTVLFPQEYMTTTDMWTSRTPQPAWGEGKSIQHKHHWDQFAVKYGYITLTALMEIFLNEGN